MNTLLLATFAVLLITNLVLQFVLHGRRRADDGPLVALGARLDQVSGTLVRLDTVLRDEARQMRVEARDAQADLRIEIQAGQK